jgi:ribosome biogenesis GTPase
LKDRQDTQQETLQTIGWGSFFANQAIPETYRADHHHMVRVTAEHRGALRVHDGKTEYWATHSGKMLHHATEKSELPAVGDWVVVTHQEGDEKGVVQWVFPRKSKFSRKRVGESTDEQIVATNIDTIFLVNALNLDFNPRRIERYLVLAWESGATPVIILSKADLCEDVEDKIAEVEQIAYGVPIHVISAIEGNGMDALEPYLQTGQTVALLGSSGAGKSTLLNAVLGEPIQAVKEVREHDHRGLHTTTARQMFFLPQGAALIDTPGMRELQLWSSEDGLSQTFDDIEELAENCKFRNCQHNNEPGCAIQEGMENGTLDAGRYRSYCKLQREMAYLHRKQDTKAKLEEEKKWKQISTQYRKRTKAMNRERYGS